MLDVTVSKQQHADVVTLVGELDGNSAPVAQERILSLAQPEARIVLDMSGVTYMSSAGLRMLLLAYRTTTGNGGKVMLAGLSDDLKDTMSMTGFLEFFGRCGSVDEGLEALR
jgi:anti-sigma B factor antagonist